MQDVVSSCPIEDAMRVLSGRWATLLLYYLKDGPKRFSELQRDNPTISHRILTLELRKLEEAGLVERTAHDGFPLKVEYALSAPGAELMPMIDAIGDWWEASSRTAASAAARPKDERWLLGAKRRSSRGSPEEIDQLTVDQELPGRPISGESDCHGLSRSGISGRKHQVAVSYSSPHEIRLILPQIVATLYKYYTLTPVNCAFRASRFELVLIRIYLEGASKFLYRSNIADGKLVVPAVD